MSVQVIKLQNENQNLKDELKQQEAQLQVRIWQHMVTTRPPQLLWHSMPHQQVLQCVLPCDLGCLIRNKGGFYVSALQAAADAMVAYHEAKTEEVDQLHQQMQQLQEDLDAAHARWDAASQLSA